MAVKVQTPPKIARLPEVIYRTGMGRTTIYNLIAQGKFPAQVALSARSVGWDSAKVDAWIADRLEHGGQEIAGRAAVGKVKVAMGAAA